MKKINKILFECLPSEEVGKLNLMSHYLTKPTTSRLKPVLWQREDASSLFYNAADIRTRGCMQKHVSLIIHERFYDEIQK